ncbi:hypothetical protein BG015_012058 [Linnemannia schmuckeri]|uniref:Uncharacterized protein n=1 Tax=Linnemannia schmuckeri TaxID=64567 RepID=A0A9P5RV73_9FUNG|nr:hypothetical protein BG015_012058 [Linnemannia schmuckeri]
MHSKSTTEFQEIDQRFDDKLVTLYKIIYAEVIGGYLGNEDEWDGTIYFHGTSHCGCTDLNITNSEDDRTSVYAWCDNAHCRTKGITNSGFLKIKSPQESPLLSIFVCVAKNPQNVAIYGFDDYHSVQNDNNILSVYIAIVSK